MRKFKQILKNLKATIVAYSLLFITGSTSLKEVEERLKAKKGGLSSKLKEKRLSRAEILRRRAQGQRPYRWGELEVWARNKVNARRKFQNIVDNSPLKMKVVHNENS